MDKRTLISILSLVSILCIAYGIYRSLAERITTVENNQEVVYNDPQHGLILGLMILAGICIWGVVYLVTRRTTEKTVQQLPTQQPIVNTGAGSTSYRPLS